MNTMTRLDINRIYEWPITLRSLIIGLLCTVVFYLAYIFDISALNFQLENARSKERDLKQQLNLIISKEYSIKRQISNFSKLHLLRDAWKAKLIHQSQIPEALNDILKMGASNYIYFNLFDPQTEIEIGQYYKLPIKIIAVGSYHQIAEFISQAANMAWIVVITDFTLTNKNKNDMLGAKLADEANAQHLLTAELTLEIYHLINPYTVKKSILQKNPSMRK